MKSPKIFLAGIMGILLFMSGCVSVKSDVADGGVFKSEDRGQNWHHKVYVSQDKKGKVTIAGTSINDMLFHPTDAQTIFLATAANGLYQSKNGGETWVITGASLGAVDRIAINRKNPEEIYITRGNQVAKSTDGGKVWNVVYTETRAINISDIEVDAYAPERIYVTLQTGELLKSNNGGVSWTVEKTFDYEIVKLMIDPRDTRKIYAFTANEGFFKSTNQGKDWKHIRDEFAEFPYALEFSDMIFDFTRQDSLLYASGYGLLRSTDGGLSWKKIQLLTPPGSVKIHTVAQSPVNAKEIYYATPEGICLSYDGGATWSIKNLPTEQDLKFINVDPLNPEVLYVGTSQPVKKKKSFFTIN